MIKIKETGEVENNLKMSKEYPLKISQVTDIPFFVEREGLFCVTVTARCGKGEDLRVEFDGLRLREIPSKDKPQYNNIPPAWNGAELKGSTKTVVFILRLNKGEHLLYFIPSGNGSAEIVQKPDIWLVDDRDRVQLDLNSQAEDGDRRPWITLALIGLPLISIAADITAVWRFRDSDDVKLIIDNEIKKNQYSILRKNWIWSGNIFKKIFGNERQEKTFVENLPKDNHYIEFWADKTPILHKVVLNLVRKEIAEATLKGKIVLYSDIELTDFVKLRKEPNTKSQEMWRLKNGEEVVIIDRTVEGEYVMNRSNVWHKIRYGGLEGFVLSSFVELDGDDRARVINKIRLQAKSKGVNESLAVAVAGCESHYKPYAVSFSGAKGIYQLTSIVGRDLQDRFNFKISEEEYFEADKNIEAGVIYLRWLFDAYNGSADQQKKIIAAWNAGKSLIPVEGPFTLQNVNSYRKRVEAEQLISCVEKRITETKAASRRTAEVIIALFFIASASMALFSFSSADNIFGRVQLARIPDAVSPRFEFYNSIEGVDLISVKNNNIKPMAWESEVAYLLPDRSWVRQYMGYLKNAYLFDADFDGTPELFIVRGQGKKIMTSVLKYNPDRKAVTDLKFVSAKGDIYDELCCSPIIYKPQGNGVQYDLAINQIERNNVRRVVYEYDFLNRVFVERTDE